MTAFRVSRWCPKGVGEDDDHFRVVPAEVTATLEGSPSLRIQASLGADGILCPMRSSEDALDEGRPAWVPAWLPWDPSSPQEHYKSAPLVEAIIEVVVSGTEGEFASLETLLEGSDGWEEWNAEEVRGVTFNVSTDEASAEAVGFAITRPSGDRQVLVGMDRVALSWRGEYETWDDLVQAFLQVWERYLLTARPARVESVSTRFVNVIQVPQDHIEITDYLRTTVDISPRLPQGVAGLFMQVDVPLDVRRRLGVVVTSALAAPEDPGHSAIALDLDTYDRDPFVINERGGRVLLERLAALRSAKNFVFEASITDATRELIRR